MSFALRALVLSIALSACLVNGQAREWSDATGNYSIDAELFGFNDETVILERNDDKQLGAFAIRDLSEEDQAYLESDEAKEINDKNTREVQTWTTKSGIELTGRIVNYDRKEVTIQRRRGRMYVNDRVFSNLSDVYQEILPRVIEYFEGVEISNDRALTQWLMSLRGQPRVFTVDGIVLEVENGDEYTIPFFLLKEENRKVLQASWSQWLAAQDDIEPEDDQPDALVYRLEALAAAHFKNQKIDRQIALANLNLQAINAGLTSAWEVTLYPLPGNPFPPIWVVMPGRNSEEAAAAALANNPGFRIGSIRRVSRR